VPAGALPGTDFRALYRQLEGALVEIERTANSSMMLEAILETLLKGFRRELGFEGGRISSREGDDYFLCCGFGSSRDVPVGLRVPRDCPPHRKTLAEGLLIMRAGEPGFDERFEHAIGVGSFSQASFWGRLPQLDRHL